MALALYIMSLIHPARTLVGPDSEFQKLTRAEKKLAKQMKKNEKQEMKVARLQDENISPRSQVNGRHA